MEYKLIETEKLIQFERRDIRESVLEKLRERISLGFNPARPLSLIFKDNNYIVADGNHRLLVCKELGIKQIPCIIRDGNLFSISIECNNDEDTYAPEDLFDKLKTIQILRDQGYTQEQIGEVLGVTRVIVSQFIVLINKIATNIIDLCKNYQIGRVANNATNVANNFTEGWFRNSGLYNLNEYYQLKTINSFIDDKCNWSNTKLNTETSKYKMWQEMQKYTIDNLHDQDKIQDIIDSIKNGAFKNENQLKSKIELLNQGSKNKLINGDSIIELEKLDDGIIDLVITDPPYGIEYKSNFSNYKDTITKTGLMNDDKNAIKIFDSVCEILNKKTKEDAHLYFFIDWKNYSEFKNIASKYFTIKTPIVWYKSNAGIGDLEYDWINGTEIILYCIKGQKPVNKRRVNVIQENRLSSSQMIHPTQKPESLINEILEVSANKHDLFCDPFMGSGSHIRAAKNYGCNYIGIELNSEMFNKAKNYINE